MTKTPKKNVHVERLLALAKYLDHIKPALLVIGWGIPNVPKKNKSGCPLGWAVTILKRQGLKSCVGAEGVAILYYKDLRGMDAAQRFFGLTFEETWMTFTPDGYDAGISPLLVTTKLRLLAARKGKRT